MNCSNTLDMVERLALVASTPLQHQFLRWENFLPSSHPDECSDLQQDMPFARQSICNQRRHGIPIRLRLSRLKIPQTQGQRIERPALRRFPSFEQCNRYLSFFGAHSVAPQKTAIGQVMRITTRQFCKTIGLNVTPDHLQQL